MEKNRTFSRYSFALILCGILINIPGAQLALHFKLPLYLDCFGTILASALGGYFPGIMVAFFSNALNSISDPVTLYYAIINVLIAVVSSFAAKRHAFSSFRGLLLCTLSFALIGGTLGSSLTWLLYGSSISVEELSPLVQFLRQSSYFTPFSAQFCSDLLFDLIDKSITVLTVWLLIKLMPDSLIKNFSLGDVCINKNAEVLPKKQRFYRSHSLKSELVAMIMVASLILSSLAITISYAIYTQTMIERYTQAASSCADLIRHTVDVDELDQFLAEKGGGDEYRIVKNKLIAIQNSLPDIEYMYVYKIKREGCYVIFDLDTPTLGGNKPGSFILHDKAFDPYLERLLSGETVPTVISRNSSYGYLLMVYKPICNTAGRCVAYAGADVAMDEVRMDGFTFVIKLTSLLFGTSILLIIGTISFAERKIVEPINAMTDAVDRFAYESDDMRLRCVASIQKLHIQTGDEIENLYHSFEKTVSDMIAYIDYGA